MAIVKGELMLASDIQTKNQSLGASRVYSSSFAITGGKGSSVTKTTPSYWIRSEDRLYPHTPSDYNPSTIYSKDAEVVHNNREWVAATSFSVAGIEPGNDQNPNNDRLQWTDKNWNIRIHARFTGGTEVGDESYRFKIFSVDGADQPQNYYVSWDAGDSPDILTQTWNDYCDVYYYVPPGKIKVQVWVSKDTVFKQTYTVDVYMKRPQQTFAAGEYIRSYISDFSDFGNQVANDTTLAAKGFLGSSIGIADDPPGGTH